MSVANGASSMTAAVAAMLSELRMSMSFVPIRSASSRVDEGSLIPALTMAIRADVVIAFALPLARRTAAVHRRVRRPR